MKKPIVTSAQLTLMIIGGALFYPYTIVPVINYLPRNQDVWITLLLSLAYVAILSIPILVLVNIFRGIRINDIMEMIAGKIVGKIFLAIYTLIFIFCFIACQLIIISFIKLYILYRTPEWALVTLMTAVILYGALKGAGVISRISLFIVPLMMLSVVILLIFSLPDISLDFLKPILAESSILDINLGAFLYASRFSEATVFFVFSYFLKKKAKQNKIYFWGVALYGLMALMIVLPVLTVLGYNIASDIWNPYYVFTRQIEVYEFLRRLQAVNILTWLPVALIKAMMYIYMASHILKNMFRSKSHKAYSIGAIIFGYLILMTNLFDKTSLLELLRSDYFIPLVTLPIIFVIPMILLITYLAKKKKIDVAIQEKRRQEDMREQSD